MSLNLLDIADDCLVEIFKYFSIPELADLTAICTQFRGIARKTFPLHHKSHSMEIDLQFVGWKVNDAYVERSQMGTVFRSFGDLLTTLEVICWDWDNDYQSNTILFNLMAKYCTEPLHQLKLSNCKNLKRDRIVDAEALFRNVVELALIDSPAIDGGFLSDAKQLKRLNLTEFHPTAVVKFLANHYPQLEALNLNNRKLDQSPYQSLLDPRAWSYPHDCGGIDIVDFLKRHPTLNSIELRGGGFYDLASIGECPWLKNLSDLGSTTANVANIAQLDQLTTLKLSARTLSGSTMEILEKSKSAESLEELALPILGLGPIHLEHVEPASLSLAALARFINLERLSLWLYCNVDNNCLADFHSLAKLRMLSVYGSTIHSLTGDAVVDLVRHLPQLEELSIYTTDYAEAHFEMEKATFLQICELYRSRQQKLVIRNYGESRHSFANASRIYDEPFAVDNEQESVRFIALRFMNLDLDDDEDFVFDD